MQVRLTLAGFPQHKLAIHWNFVQPANVFTSTRDSDQRRI
jgi:hypothetical protein